MDREFQVIRMKHTIDKKQCTLLIFNDITEDDQKRKLELVVKTAEAIWGEV